MALDHQKQQLASNFDPELYKLVEKDVGSISEHILQISSYIKKNILPGSNYSTFLDIGAGPGDIAITLAQYFKKATFIDSNESYLPEYEKIKQLFPNSTEFVIDSFESVNFSTKYDFILCSHMLYHIPKIQWHSVLLKIYSLLNPSGQGLIAMVAPRGNFHLLCSMINPAYSHSKDVETILQITSISYYTKKMKCKYVTQDRKKFITLVRLFVIDNCFTPEEYGNASDSKKKKIEEEITQFVNKCKNSEGTYEFFTEEDYITVYK